jgi:protein TonB
MSSSAAITDLPTNSALEGTPTDLLKPSAALPAGTEKSSYRPEAPTRLINVSSGVMAANVLSAPQPSYPKLASLTHMQGEVVMQAIISKRGRIENVRVIKGHRLLRGAATNAVRSWRYRPYLVDGRPVQVATIVSVDFKLVR